MVQRKAVCLASLLLAGLVTLQAAAQKNDKAESLLQAAQHKQLVEGDLKGAIQLYQRIIAQHGNNRAAAAKALVQMGKCYEKLGKAEARKTYDQVVRNYGDQREMVAEARARLSALGPSAGNVIASKAARGLTVRQVPVGPDMDRRGGSISPDGRYLSGLDETGGLIIQELITGEKRRLMNKATNEWLECSIFSPDGKQIVAFWGVYQGEKVFWELRLIGIDGTGSRLLHRSDIEKVRWIWPFDWSPDGKHILVYFREGTRNSSKDIMVLISVADGSTRVLKTLSYEKNRGGFNWPARMSFSPDGHYIAFSFSRDGSDQCDIAVISSDGSRDVPLVQSPADDKLLGWAPDGKNVLFTSDRSKTIDAWIIPVAEGKPQGSPELVTRDLGKVWPMGFTRSRSFYYNFGGNRAVTYDIYTAELAPGTGKLGGSPALAKTRYIGFNGGHDWSPDGRYQVYRSSPRWREGNTELRDKLFILNPETGEEREVQSKLLRFSPPRWFPDGKSILVRDQEGGTGLFKIDSETGAATLLVPEKPGSEFFHPVLSRDGKAVFYQNKNILWKRNLETGEDKEIYRATPPTKNSWFSPSVALSPDGQRFAFKFRQSLIVVPATGGDARELLKLREPEILTTTVYGRLVWTPDGRYLLFFDGSDKQPELWRIPADGGDPQKLGQLMEGAFDLRIHPDGQRIAFTVEQRNKGAGVWVMENFLPAAQPRKTAMSRR